MRTTIRFLLFQSLLLGAGLAAGAAPAASAAAAPMAATARAEPPPAEHFAASPRLGSGKVSPSGRHLVMMMNSESGRRVAAVAAMDKPSEFKVVAAFSNADVEYVHWVNDRRLIYAGATPGAVIEEGGAGVFAVDLDGERRTQLVAWVLSTAPPTGTRVAARMLPFGWFLYDTLDDGSDDVLMYQWRTDPSGNPQLLQLARVNSVNGQLRTLSAGAPPFAERWLVDAAGELRITRVVHEGMARLFWRAPGSNEWTLVDERSQLAEDELLPLALEGETDLLVETRSGADTAALHVYDLRKRELQPEPVAALQGFDLEPGMVMNRRKSLLLGLHTRAAQPVSVWFDEALAKAQQRVDASLPEGRSNRLDCGRCENPRHFLINSRGDRQPGQWLVFDSQANRLQLLGASRPWLDEATQGRRSFHRVPARDGLPLPVVMTSPAGEEQARPLPTVLLVHGGPWVRGGDRLWSGEAQFLASRGWRVLEVEFRSSTGFGWRHFRAGWREWGRAMQDDLLDALDWAVREGWSDRQRVCIYGSSYGGYAALMGAVRDGEHYRCAVSHVGVTDIDLMVNARWTDIPPRWARHGIPQLVGDLKAEAERLRQVSPLHRVAEIKIPVLLAQGVHDRRVPSEHANRFMAAARRAGVPVERVDYEEGHGWRELENHADFLRRLEAFMQRAFEPR